MMMMMMMMTVVVQGFPSQRSLHFVRKGVWKYTSSLNRAYEVSGGHNLVTAMAFSRYKAIRDIDKLDPTEVSQAFPANGASRSKESAVLKVKDGDDREDEFNPSAESRVERVQRLKGNRSSFSRRNAGASSSTQYNEDDNTDDYSNKEEFTGEGDEREWKRKGDKTWEQREDFGARKASTRDRRYNERERSGRENRRIESSFRDKSSFASYKEKFPDDRTRRDSARRDSAPSFPGEGWKNSRPSRYETVNKISRPLKNQRTRKFDRDTDGGNSYDRIYDRKGQIFEIDVDDIEDDGFGAEDNFIDHVDELETIKKNERVRRRESGGNSVNRDSFRSKERKQFGKRKGSSSNDGDRKFSPDRNRGGFDGREREDRWRSKEKEEESQPQYGSYDGDHLFGIAPVLAALKSKRRQFSELIVQEGMTLEKKKDAASQILDLVKALKVPIREFSKHSLNMMADNRPHQGFILRAKKLQYQPIDREPLPSSQKIMVALDEVNDPQNLGALLRSCHYLGCSAVVVSAKNSAPLSAVVSKASSGAMELMNLYSTKNMMSLIERAKLEGWLVVGTDISDKCVPMSVVPKDRPLMLLLGNEGYGLRTNILSRCDYLVTIPRGLKNSQTSASTQQSGESLATYVPPADDSSPSSTTEVIHTRNEEDSDSLVDSLNVSVTGGILLHYFLNR